MRSNQRAKADADDRARGARGRDRREEIVDAAIRLFADKGFRGASITELAERVGMTHPGLLYYFGTKQRLLLDVVHEREEREGAAILVALGQDTTDLPSGLRAVARFVAGDAVLPTSASSTRSSALTWARALTSSRIFSRWRPMATSTRSRTSCSTSRPT